MISCYIFSRDRMSCRILFGFGRGEVELLPYNKQASGELLPVRCIVTDQKSFLALRDNKSGDIHSDMLMDGLLGSSKFACFMSIVRSSSITLLDRLYRIN